MLYLYNPKTNVTERTTQKMVSEISGLKEASLASYRSRKNKIAAIDCYLLDDEPSIEDRRKWYSSIVYKDEAWKIIEGSNDQFKISTYGRVKRIFKNHERFLMPFRRKQAGNLRVKARFLNKYKDHVIGHIVAHHFIGKRKDGLRVYRKNGIITDDYVGNLKYVTVEDLGRITGHTSRNIPIVQLDFETKEYINEFNSIREAGRKLHISHEAIRHNVIGRSKRCNDFVFVSLKVYERLT